MNEIPKKRFACGRRVLMGMAMRPATVQSVAEVPSQMGEFEHEVWADAESQARRVLGCDLYAIPALDADLRSMTGPTINFHNSNVANLNFGAQVGAINAQVIEQAQKR